MRKFGIINTQAVYPYMGQTVKHSKSVKKRKSRIVDIEPIELFEKFIEYKSKSLYASTLVKYRAILKHLANYRYEDSSDDFVYQLPIAPRTKKDYLSVLSACWDWGIEKQLVTNNPWKNIKVRVPPKKPPKPFTKEEIKLILEKIEELEPHYLPYVQFLLATGVRISEAIGLRWSDIDWTDKTIWIGETLTRGNRKETKNGKARLIPINEIVEEILKNLVRARSPKLDSDELVFVSTAGSAIDDHNFRSRVWKKCLSAASVTYRKPYNCRHTCISHLLNLGMSPATIASMTGHRVQTLYEHYAGCVITRPELPSYF